MKTASTIEYKKYRWFFTSSGKLIIGGKNADQNDSLLLLLKSLGNEYIVMHTSDPGSPFSVIIADPSKVSKKDKEEAAIFTGCFSRAWRLGMRKTDVNIFYLSQLFKISDMKQGTWGVKGKVEKMNVSLELVLTKQKSSLRAVPKITVKSKKDILLYLYPGKIDKKDMISKIQIALNFSFKQEELLSALPAGSIKIKR